MSNSVPFSGACSLRIACRILTDKVSSMSLSQGKDSSREFCAVRFTLPDTPSARDDLSILRNKSAPGLPFWRGARSSGISPPLADGFCRRHPHRPVDARGGGEQRPAGRLPADGDDDAEPRGGVQARSVKPAMLDRQRALPSARSPSSPNVGKARVGCEHLRRVVHHIRAEPEAETRERGHQVLLVKGHSGGWTDQELRCCHDVLSVDDAHDPHLRSLVEIVSTAVTSVG